MVSALDSSARGWGFRSAIHETHGKGPSPAIGCTHRLRQPNKRSVTRTALFRYRGIKQRNDLITGQPDTKGQLNGSKIQEQRNGAVIKMYEL